MSEKPQPAANFGINNDDFSFLDQYVHPDWSTVVDPAQNGAESNFFAGLPDFNKDTLFMEPLPFDIGSFMPNMGENLSISTKDIFTPVNAQQSTATAGTSSANAFEPSLAAFSDSASPAESHSPSQSASAHADDIHTESETDSDEDEFKAPTKRGSTSKGRATSAAAKTKRAANKPKPYPRVSDVVRDAPHKLAVDSKRQPATTELKGSVRTADAADDDWRPTMEEYQKMSSKEKRQLRNKISARNFRVRRKEYITTLEGEVAVRDQQLETYREELTSTRSENTELRKEIERLRKEIMEGRGGASIFEQSPVDSKAGILSQANGKVTRSSKAPVARANRNKDLPASGSTRGFWGGSTMGGATSVHTTLIPEFDISAISGKPRLQENINPQLNSLSAVDESLSQVNINANLPLLSSGLDGLHNFTFKGLDGDRMQLWSRMAREAGAAQALREKLMSSPASSTHSSLGSSGYQSSSVLSNAHVSPLFFTAPATQIVKKEAGKALSTPQPTAAQAALATSLSNTVANKLMGAVWGAFAPKSALDLDRVKKVLEGKAELRYHELDTSSSSAALEESMKAMTLSTPTPAPLSRKSSVNELEDSLKSMSLAPAAATRMDSFGNKEKCNQTASCVGIFSRPMRAGHLPTPAHQPTTKHQVAAQH